MRVYVKLDENTFYYPPEEEWGKYIRDLEEVYLFLSYAGISFGGVRARAGWELELPSGFVVNLRAEELNLEDLLLAHRVCKEKKLFEALEKKKREFEEVKRRVEELYDAFFKETGADPTKHGFKTTVGRGILVDFKEGLPKSGKQFVQEVLKHVPPNPLVGHQALSAVMMALERFFEYLRRQDVGVGVGIEPR